LSKSNIIPGTPSTPWIHQHPIGQEMTILWVEVEYIPSPT
jgi:hypothetical protein